MTPFKKQLVHPVRVASRALGLSLALAGSIFAEPGIPATLNFAGGNALSGEILRINQDHTLDFSSASLSGQSKLKTATLLSAKLSTTPPVEKGEHFVIATINNHFQDDANRDTIRGKLISIGDEKIVLDTSFAGRLTLDRRMVMGLEFFTSSPLFYRGPDELSKWTFSSGKKDDTWEQAGRFLIARSNTGIAREIKSAPRTHISYTMNWKGRGTYRFLFFSDDGESISPNNRYELSVNSSSYLRLTRFSSDNGRNETIFQRSYSALRNQDRATFDFYIDRTGENPSALLIDGKILHTWTEDKEAQTPGDWFHFCPEEATPLRLTNLSLSQWDGKLPKSELAESDEGEVVPSPEAALPDDEFEKMEGQHIELKNGDTIIGKIREVTDGRLMAETTYGDIAIPVERAANINLDIGKKHEPKMWNGEIRAWYHNGGFLTLQLISQDGQKIHASSQVFGEADIDLNAFSRIDFNIWQRELESERSGSVDW